MRFRRCRRMTGGVVVALVTLVSWDQTSVFPLSAVAPEARGIVTSLARPVEVAGVSYNLAGDFTSLTPRLRMPPVAPAETETLALGPDPDTAAPAGDSEIAPPPAEFGKAATSAAAAAPPAQLRASGEGSSGRPPSGVTPAGGTWAVLVGINDYPGNEFDLRSAVNDVNDVNDALGKLGVPGDRRLILRDGQATASTIRSAIDWLKAHAAPEATAVFFFAGHVRKVGGSTEAILGADGETIQDVELAALLDGLAAKRTWIGIAACYGGGFTEVVRPGRILTAAAPADSLAYENDQFGRSYLVEYMIRRGMIGKGFITVEAAFSWALAELRRDYPNRLPVQDDRYAGDLDLRPSMAAPAPTGSSGGQPPPSGGGGSGDGGSAPPPSDPNEGCSNLTIGVVRCN